MYWTLVRVHRAVLLHRALISERHVSPSVGVFDSTGTERGWSGGVDGTASWPRRYATNTFTTAARSRRTCGVLSCTRTAVA